MNLLEKEMLEVLKVLKNDYGVFEIKAEFEAEGSRMEELMRLKDLTSSVGLPIILKIGGAEAVTDIYNALSIGVKGIIAPMIETSYALYKYLKMIETMIAEDNAQDIDFAFNIETITACLNLVEMFELPEIKLLTGVTIGRVDLAGSMRIDRKDINTSELILLNCQSVFIQARSKGLKTGLGGAISKEALEPISILTKDNLLDKFETRKVVFPAEAWRFGEEAIKKAVEFELLWLKSKRRYYSRIKEEDEKRIEMLEARK
ncbi:MAG TPA: aldolase/citrate lyase family protein [Candidatus Cloacimonas sp.]|nr:aldolase/citrate lyase family protein [Candidatus Cloacimonas sp.]